MSAIKSALIRQAQVEDVPEISALFLRVWAENLARYAPPGFIDQFAKSDLDRKYAQRVSSPDWIVSVALVNNRVVGMATARDNDAEPLSYQRQIRSMYVLPDYQRSGIGSALLLDISTKLSATDSKSVLLWCIQANVQACRFYEKFGAGKIVDVATPPEYSAMPHVIYAWPNWQERNPLNFGAAMG